jgi:hypothetical protein
MKVQTIITLKSNEAIKGMVSDDLPASFHHAIMTKMKRKMMDKALISEFVTDNGINILVRNEDIRHIQFIEVA